MMKRTSVRQILVLLSVFTISMAVCDAQPLGTGPVGHTKSGLFGLSFGKKKNGKIKGPKSVNQVKKEQEKKDKKANEEYVKSVKESQKRSIEIQTPEVRTRMKQNQQEVTAREKARQKKTLHSTRKARKKYKK